MILMIGTGKRETFHTSFQDVHNTNKVCQNLCHKYPDYNYPPHNIGDEFF